MLKNNFAGQTFESTFTQMELPGSQKLSTLIGNGFRDPQTIAFIDSNVSSAMDIMAGVQADIKIFLDPTRDGVTQITEALEQYKCLSSISIISHGNASEVQLGNGLLNDKSLPQYSNQLQQWKSSLAQDADILFYGCGIAAGEFGKAFIDRVSQLTDADVAASTDTTGNSAKGGNWNLEYATGTIETITPFTNSFISSYQGLLPTFYLSDLTATAATNGWGAIEKDKSNGNGAPDAIDGNTLTLNGIAYNKGLGVHAGSDTTYALSGNYTRFISDIGVDDEVGGNGSVIFQVFADGVNIYDSGLMTGSTATKTVNVDVTAKQNLRLVVTDSGNGNGYDHADWANARLENGPPTPDTTAPTATLNATPLSVTPNSTTPYTFTVTYNDNVAVNSSTLDSTDLLITGPNSYSQLATFISATPSTNGSPLTATYRINPPAGAWDANETGTYTVALQGNQVSDTSNNAVVATTLGTFQVNVSTSATVYLSDLTATAATNGWGAIEKDKSNGNGAPDAIDGNTLTLNGIAYNKGLGVHAGSDTTYALSGNYTRFISDIGVDDEVGGNGSVIFQVFADGVNIYDSGLMTGSTATKTVNVDVTAKQNLRLVVTDSGNGNGYDHADWANARLENGPPTPDTTAPTATLNATPLSVTPNSTTPYTFTVTYNDNVAVNSSTLDSTDLLITGPNSYSQLATFISATPSTNGSPLTATYRINPPAGAWDANETGTYTVALQGNQVSDTSNNAVVATTLGTFQVNVSTSATVYLSDLTATAATNGWGAIEKDKSNGNGAPDAIDGNTLTLNGIAYNKGLGVHAGSDTTYALSGNYTRFISDIGVDDEVGGNGSVIFQVFADGVNIYDSGLMTGSTATKTVNVDVTAKQNLRLVVTDSGNGNGYDHADWANARLTSEPLGPDTSPPAPTLTAAAINSSISAPYTFSVTYTDTTSVNVSTINGSTTSSDVRVTGSNGYSQLAQLVSVTPNINSPTVTAVYQITATDGIWNWNDRGTYTATLLAGAVRDTLNNTTATDTTLGTFQNTVESIFVFATNSSQVAEGNAINITVRRQGDTSGTASIDYFTGGNSTATPNVNYTPIPITTLTFGPTETEKTITVQTLDDGVANTNKTVSLLIQNPIGADLGTSRTSAITINDTAGPTLSYLSDLPFTSTNGWGVVERDRSNGDIGAADGNPLKLEGTTYAKGIGAHSNSQINYNLGGNYNSFFAYVGVDDEVSGGGSVVFQILADGELLYDSGLMSGLSSTKLANVNVTGKQNLTLIVNDGGNGNGSDHADWADAQLVVGSYTPPQPQSKTILREQVVTGLNRPTTFDWSPDGQLMFIAEKGGIVKTFVQSSTLNFAPVQSYSTGTSTHGITSADFNGDGRLDLVTANATDNNVSVLLGNGNGTFSSAVNFGVGIRPKSVFAADFNQDGRLDLFTANQDSNDVSVLLGNGNGTFATAVNYAGTSGSHEAVAADVDGDGDIDIAVTGTGASSVRVMRNNGNGTFGSFAEYAVGSVPHSLNLTDFNGDNRPDIAVANQESDNISILLNSGTGTFSAATNIGVGGKPHSIRAADLNGDGKIDLVSDSQTDNSVSILLGNGTGGFAPAVRYATGLQPVGVALSDMNGDGKIDIVTSNIAGNYPNGNNPGGNTVSVLLGSGDGKFAAPTTFFTGITPFDLTIADFNNDGKGDIATANWLTNNVGVLINTTANASSLATGLQPTPFIDISEQVNDVADRGLLGMAIDPLFGRNQNRDFVYLAFTYDPPEAAAYSGLAGRDGQGNRPARLIRVTADPTTNFTTAIQGSEVVLLGKNSLWQYTSNPGIDSTVNLTNLPSGIANGSTVIPPITLIEDADPINLGRDYSATDTNFDLNNNIRDYLAGDSDSHSIGQVQFAPDGSLYVTVGDGTSYNSVDWRSTRVQDVDSLSGKLLRINPLTGQGYADNPFSNGNLDSNRSKVWSLGVRNSFRFAFNPTTGTPYLGDVGWTAWEEINVATRGSNFGWPYFEGPNQNLGYSTLPQAQAFYSSGQAMGPLLTRNHNANLNPDGLAATALIMGEFYTGTSLPSIYNGALFYNDVGLGTVYATILNPDGTVQSTQIVDNLPYIVRMKTGPDGYLYYASLYGNAIGRWKPA
jgi:glucose/arabinose dehydrogenase